jgi:hypothetical protein
MKSYPTGKWMWGSLLLAAGLWAALPAQEKVIPFDAEHWQLDNARVIEHLGRPALAGTAFLKGAEFENGVIEFDVAVTGARSYPGVMFRVQPDGSWERIYLRPHRSGRIPPSLYADVVQYVPSWNRVDSWQLYNGDGCTAPAWVPGNEWVHVKVDVAGTMARIFVADMAQPALVIRELRLGVRRGGIGLQGPPDGSAFFSNVTFRSDDSLVFPPQPRRDPLPGIIRSWELSRPFRALAVDSEKTPAGQGLTDLAWQPVNADEAGLVDVARFYPRSGEPDLVFARTVISSTQERVLKLNIGYSDAVSLFLNGRLLFSASSGYTTRDPSFLGIVGLQDTVYLPLRPGENELLLAVSEVMGGWGFKAQDGDAIFAAPGVSPAWETARDFRFPESAAWDPASKAIYVSHYDPFRRSSDQGLQVISKLGPDGRVEKLDWLAGLKNPTGLVVRQGHLFAVEPRSLAEIDIASARLIRRLEVPGAKALNDITVDARGNLYLSDSAADVIFCFTRERFETWLAGPDLSRPNGVCVWNGKLVWGNNGDGKLKAADLKTKAVTEIADLGDGLIDGIAALGGGLLVSHNQGRLFSVTPQGDVTRLLDTTVRQQNTADLTFVPELGLAICPGWISGNVTAWRLPGAGRR